MKIILSVRIFISDPGTPKAETCLAYCQPDEAVVPDDVIIEFRFNDCILLIKEVFLSLWMRRLTLTLIHFGGQLTIKGA